MGCSTPLLHAPRILLLSLILLSHYEVASLVASPRLARLLSNVPILRRHNRAGYTALPATPFLHDYARPTLPRYAAPLALLPCYFGLCHLCPDAPLLVKEHLAAKLAT